MSTKIFGAAILNSHDLDNSVVHKSYRASVLIEDKPNGCWRGLWRKLLGLAVFIFPASIAFVIAGPLVAALVAVWQCAVTLVVLMMMGARLCSVVKEE